jgi:ethanolamine ammonia-lyase large subunit
MAVTSRETLSEYCLRALGAPVLEINVDDDQLEDRIDEALDVFRLYHYDGIEKIYLKHKITASELNITGTNAASFAATSKITGGTSGATAIIESAKDNNTLYISRTIGAFVANETITNPDGTTATLTASSFYTAGDVDNGWIPIPDLVYGVSRVLPLYQGTSSSRSIFDLQYQLRLNDLYDLSSTSLIYYTTVMQHLATLDLVLNGKPIYRFNRLMDKLYVDIDWKSINKVNVGDYFIVEAYRALDPTEFSKVWNEPWLKKYVTALFKKQWATNLKKFSGLQLPGGVTLDGNSLYNEAVQEIIALEDDIQNKSAPLDFFLG